MVEGVSAYIDQLICRDDASPQRLYACQDANSNLTAITDISGDVAERYGFDPYGTRTIMDASWGVLSASAYDWVIGHQGLMHDVESGQVYNRWRYLNPALGNWPNRDARQYADGSNLYLYLRNNPQNLDPLGQTAAAGLILTGECCEAEPGIGTVVGGVVIIGGVVIYLCSRSGSKDNVRTVTCYWYRSSTGSSTTTTATCYVDVSYAECCGPTSPGADWKLRTSPPQHRYPTTQPS
jgi:RHS repeat-associated protein